MIGGVYKRHLDPEPHVIGKQNTQKIVQTFNATDANQAAGAEKHLFFKARSKA